MFINNRRVLTGDYFEVFNPFSNEVIGKVASAGDDEIEKALFLSSKTKNDLSGFERSRIIEKCARLILKNRNDLAVLISKESGLCLKDSYHEIDRGINCLKFCSEQAKNIDNLDPSEELNIPVPVKNPQLHIVFEPINLILGITPFNHPLNMLIHKIGPAIAVGAPIIIKPSEQTPFTALKLGELFIESGLSANMLNIITGSPPQNLVEKLVTDSRVDLVSFTGSVKIGKSIAKMMALNGNELKKYMPELGGNATFVVLDDADLDKAAKIALGAFENSGQRCTAIRKILLHQDISDLFIDKFVDLSSQIKYGDPLDPENDMGTVITVEQAKLLKSRIEKAIKDGAEVLYGNEINGALMSPTILDMVDSGMEIAVKESFGPVVSIMRVKDLNEIKNYFKRDNFGLAASVATQSKEKAYDIFNSSLVGQFSWNGTPGYRTEEAPFGGFKDSGNGEKEGVIMMTRAMRRIKTFYNHNN